MAGSTQTVSQYITHHLTNLTYGKLPQGFEREDGSTKNDTNINAFVAFRIGIGYNSDKFFAGLNYVTKSRSTVFDDIRFTNSTSTFRLLVGYRFREFGILKRSVKEIPTALGF